MSSTLLKCLFIMISSLVLLHWRGITVSGLVEAQTTLEAQLKKLSKLISVKWLKLRPMFHRKLENVENNKPAQSNPTEISCFCIDYSLCQSSVVNPQPSYSLIHKILSVKCARVNSNTSCFCQKGHS